MKLLVLILLSFISYTGYVYGFEGENTLSGSNDKSIRELQNDIYSLNRDKNLLQNEFSNLLRNGNLESLFRDDLTSSDIKKLRGVSKVYAKHRDIFEELIDKNAKIGSDTSVYASRLLEVKKDLFKRLVPYIQSDKRDEYLEFVRKDVAFMKERKELESELIKKENEITDKVEGLEKRIKEHKDLMNEKILLQIDKKIEALKNNLRFQGLSEEAKILVIQKVIIQIQKKSLDPKNDSSKRDMYNTVLNRLDAFMKSFGNQK